MYFLGIAFCVMLPLPRESSLLPAPCSLLPAPCSLLPAPWQLLGTCHCARFVLCIPRPGFCLGTNRPPFSLAEQSKVPFPLHRPMASNYTEASIKTLSSLEHI